jgi:general secretion pathway protein L
MTQSNLNIIRWNEEFAFFLRPGSQPEKLDGEPVNLPENTCLALPADSVRTLPLSVSPDEVKHLRRALPFMLEETLLEDVAELHFANAPLDNDRHAVAVVKRQMMNQWVASLPESLKELPWVSEALCLPWSPGYCTLVFEEAHVLVRWGEASGTRIEQSLLAALLESLPMVNVSIVAYCSDEAIARASLPDSLQQGLQIRQGGLSEALLLANAVAPTPDLRQGDYAPRLPYARWLGIWQRVLIALGVAIVLKTGVSVIDYVSLKKADIRLREGIQQSYRRVNPKGAVVDVEKQLDRQLAQLGATGTQSAFTPVLVELLSAMTQVRDIELTSVNYTGGKDVRVNFSAPDFQAVEQVRVALEARNFTAELENSNARKEGVVARLRVESRR